MTNIYYVYILLCENGAYYTGYTNDLERRYEQHVLGTGKCKFTRSFKPILLAQSWKIKAGKSMALKIERFIKTLTKEQKKILIEHPRKLTKLIASI
jgi:putative endonuclease